MANPVTISWSKYGWETTFGTVAGTIDKTLGQGIKITTLQRKNNIESVFTLGSRNAQELVPEKYEGLLGLEFALANPWFLRAVFGTVTSTGTNPTTHTFTESDTIPSISFENDVDSDTPSVAKLLGCKVEACTITCAIGEIARVKLDLPFANETHGSSTSAQVAETFELYTFAYGSLELPDGTTLADVQNVEVAIKNKTEPIFGLGSRFAQQMPVKEREYTAKATLAFEASANLLTKLYGGSSGPVANPAETATMELVFDNGLTSANQRQISMVFTGVQLDDHNMPQDPTTVLMEDASLIMRSCVCTAKNATTVSP